MRRVSHGDGRGLRQADLPIAAHIAAMRKFKAVGWHLDAGTDRRARVLEQALRDGSGLWYCPSCARRTHL
jgi:hypothetical protein